ncbi:RNA polymerase II subunit A C-terminal domain phosphatase [Anthonomus grandis grandis]|uniref:RNA polymerase II subunit A C-terminal domain phosphatase n=1 Tax=Anthonomus grandis grandis TaxID=2921223 RepID=UPI002165BD7A|nr:RNA polymerase II subunit A C-terminal domain phosphatase [Anthonomus grandis grandis]
MADVVAVPILQTQTKPIKIVKWKVRKGSAFPVGRILLIYQFADEEKPEQKKLKATAAGIVHKIVAKEGKTVLPGEPLFEMNSCSHPTIMNDMCAECGEDLRKDDAPPKSTASVPMIHAIPELKVSEEQAQKLGQADNDRLIKDRKLVLLVDLDQTLIHTTNDNIPPNIKDVYHFQLYGPKSPWYHTRLRPGTHKFLSSICEFYELHICTFGARNYAHMIAMFLDPEGKFFGSRILSRDECFDPTSKKANLSALFPCGDDMVCIIDDREDVWSHALNLIHVKPYHFFQHTGDINAPPGLDKHEADDKEGVDLTKIVKNNKTPKEKPSEATEVDSKEDKVNPSEKTDEEMNENEVETTTKSEEAEEMVKTDTTTNGELSKSEEVESEEHNGKLKAAENVKKPATDDGLIEIEDPDDYLVYLEDVLKRIHRAYYEMYDKMEAGKIPDLKKVIPNVKCKVLKGTKLVFSGLVPTHYKLEQSKAYQVARSLGAEVQNDLDDDTTHLVAVRPGTAKVNAGRRRKNLKIVTPDWLWCCAERWEHADERIFPLNSKGSKNRHPPPHCSSPEHVPDYPEEHETPGMRKRRTPSGRFMDTINPLMSFSTADIADMDKEVEDILEDDESDEDTENEQARAPPGNNEEEEEENDTDMEEVNFKHMIETEILGKYNTQEDDERESTNKDEDIEEEVPKAEEEEVADRTECQSIRIQRKKPRISKKRKRLPLDAEGDNSQEEEFPSEKFRRGEDCSDELDNPDRDSDDVDSSSFSAPPSSDEEEWNMMGAELEREFLLD